MAISIEPMAERHIEGFHHALDTVARERKFLAHLEAPPLEQVRQFALASLARASSDRSAARIDKMMWIKQGFRAPI